MPLKKCSLAALLTAPAPPPGPFRQLGREFRVNVRPSTALWELGEGVGDERFSGQAEVSRDGENLGSEGLEGIAFPDMKSTDGQSKYSRLAPGSAPRSV